MDKNLRPSILKRLIALFVDFIILGITGYVSGLLFEDFYVSLGRYGTLVGSTITIIYFSVLQSKLGGGQTLGKVVVGAKVTDLKGEYLTFGKSFLRSFILFFPIMNMEIFAVGNGMLVIMMLLMFTTFASLYFILVNRSRRCLHDILVSSIVINENVTEFEINDSNDRSLKKIIPLAVFATIIIGISFYQFSTEPSYNKLLDVKEQIENIEGVITVNEVKSSMKTYYNTDEPSTTYSSIKVTVRIDNKEEALNSNSHYFNKFYKIIKTEIPESQNMDGVSITLFYGYNIAIASKSRSVTRTFEN